MCDATEIPFAEKSFDVVIANHMLYHMDNLEKVLSEIRRVLTPKGVLYASTIGKGHLKELRSLVLAIEPRVDFASEKAAENFGLENGKEILSTYFKTVDVAIYEDSLLVPEVDPIIAYILSIGNAKTLLSEAKLDHFSRYLENELAKHGTITISKSTGMFKATGSVPRQIEAFFHGCE